ncbi:hypothetical protein HU200_000232 [Digitaria exilis]|uniref:Uncharacterized protein n=1 Tax=Digitaria exilis TaxID=1010633 RepID=A0A835KXD9_9POAL|nr:hypothetical protein HU200_000232 [Digitaria exilis]
MLRLRACGGKAPALVPALVRARLARRASSAAAYAAAATTVSASSALEELAAERKGRRLPFFSANLSAPFRSPAPAVSCCLALAPRICSLYPILYRAPEHVSRVGGGVPRGRSGHRGGFLFVEMPKRILHFLRFGKDPACALNMERLLEARISSAVDLRRRLGLPSADTNAYRLINSEGDRLSGLIVDIFADVAVIASSAAWVEKYREEIQFFVSKLNGINHIKWRPSEDILKEEGLDVSDYKEPSSSCSAVKVDVLTASIDSSGSALNLANENIILNELSPERISFVKGDATAFMKGAVSSNELWDMVILDPPKLAPRKKVLQSASGMYRNLNALAMQVVKPGGLLMTCSCSGAMTQSGMFLKTIQGAALMADRKVTVLRQTGAACDHPIDPAYPEGQYLSNYLLRVS